MTSPISKLTPENAPRDLVSLAHAGRFALRSLARDLRITESDDANVAFMGLTTDKQADEILKALQAYDRDRGAPPQAAPPAQTMTAPASAPHTGTNGTAGPSVPAAAVPPPQEKRTLRRQPQNNGVPAQPSQPLAQTPPMAQMAPSTGGVGAPVDLTPLLDALAGLEAKVVKMLKEDKREILDELEYLRQQVAVSMGLTVVGLQQTIAETTPAIVEAAYTEAPVVQDALTALGKAAKKG